MQCLRWFQRSSQSIKPNLFMSSLGLGLHLAFIANWAGCYWAYKDDRRIKKVLTLSVWPGAAAKTFPLLQSHTQIVFLESKPTDTRHCEESKEQEITSQTDRAWQHWSLRQKLNHFHCSMDSFSEELIKAVVGPLALPESMFECFGLRCLL